MQKRKERSKRRNNNNKKTDKQLKCRTVDNPVRENSSDDEIKIYYQDDTDDEALVELMQQPNTACAACFGTEQRNVNNAWKGCSTCEAWIHRGCVSTEVERMTEAHIRKLKICLLNT